jgi:hypothetical protein
MTTALAGFLASATVGAIVFGAATPVAAEVPKAEDVTNCNREAQAATQSGGSRFNAQPNANDDTRAAQARRDTTSRDRTGDTVRSPDAQIEGMDAEGAKDPAYQAAFRVCMRRSGF